MDDTAIAAASWALATEVARIAGPRFTITEGHPGDGQYDVLWVLPTADLGRGATDGPQALLNRTAVCRPRGSRRQCSEDHRRHGHEVAATVDRVELLVWRIAAVALAQAALFGSDVWVLSASLDTSDYADEEVHRDLLRPYGDQLADGIDTMSQTESRRYWLVGRGEQWDAAKSEPIACLDSRGRLLHPGSDQPIVDLESCADDLSLAHSIGVHLVADVVIKHTQAAPRHAPGLGSRRSCLHGALAWARGAAAPGQGDEAARVVAVEAKVYGAWSNAQMLASCRACRRFEHRPRSMVLAFA